jgi:hypothetical protein
MDFSPDIANYTTNQIISKTKNKPACPDAGGIKGL